MLPGRVPNAKWRRQRPSDRETRSARPPGADPCSRPSGRALCVVSASALRQRRRSGRAWSSKIGSSTSSGRRTAASAVTPAVYVDLANHPMLGRGRSPRVDPRSGRRARRADARTSGAAAVEDARRRRQLPRPRRRDGSRAADRAALLRQDAELHRRTASTTSSSRSASTQVDYEAELVVVFGRTCKARGRRRRVEPSRRRDVRPGRLGSVRAAPAAAASSSPSPRATTRSARPGRCSSPPTSSPTATRWRSRARCRGEVMQDSNTDDLIFGVASLVEWLSRYITFHPGDLLLTGTPGGVGEARSPQRLPARTVTSSRRRSTASGRCATGSSRDACPPRRPPRKGRPPLSSLRAQPISGCGRRVPAQPRPGLPAATLAVATGTAHAARPTSAYISLPTPTRLVDTRTPA